MNATERSDIEWGPPIDGATMRFLDLPPETPVRVRSRNGGPDAVYPARMWRLDESEPIYRIRADHPHYAQQPDWTPCERTVRYIVATVNALSLALWVNDEPVVKRSDMLAALESLLPKKPSRAEELVEKFYAVDGPLSGLPMDRDPGVASIEACRNFARWLESKGEIK